MAKVRPFKGFRPSPELAPVVSSRPYDVLSSQEAFDEWKEEYLGSLSEEERFSFIEKYYAADADYSSDYYEVTLELPQEIVDLAKAE